jgi:anti-sigma regulatory factor (Ser/Thr protein kinase)
MNEIAKFIIDNVDDHPVAVGSLAAERFAVSRTTISKHMKRLVDAGTISAEGNTRGRRYGLLPLSQTGRRVNIEAGMAEDILWREAIQPAMISVPENVRDICAHGFTEIFNNVLDHSQSEDCLMSYRQDAKKISIMIGDNGVGIFEKIKTDFNLYDHRQALLELSKGKLTSDPDNHTGEGIFFTSRMFNRFMIDSKELTYIRTRKSEDWLIEIGASEAAPKGTTVLMDIDLDVKWTAQDIFDKYVDDNNRFSVTHVPLKLAKYPEEQLVSRSQARRVLARVERFAEVLLDFEDVATIGQAFADEIFRVFHRQHPDIKIIAIGTNHQVQRMIDHANANAEDDQPTFL